MTGTVLSVDSSGITVDVGAKNAAFCPAAEAAFGKAGRVR